MSVLLSLAAQIGATTIQKILSRKIGDAGGELAGDVVREIAKRVGVPPAEIERVAHEEPDQVIRAIRDVEQMSPELIALYATGLERQFDLLESEATDPNWMRAWRPLAMYMLGLLWVWAVVIVPLLRAFGVPVDPVDLGTLMTLTGVYMGLYMGGHTVKDVAAKVGGRR